MGLEFDPKEAILHHEEGVDLIPSNKLLAGMDMSLFTVEDREKVLKEYLELLKDEYDYILIDCMPSLGMLTLNALSAADSVLIPVQPQYYAADGLMELLKAFYSQWIIAVTIMQRETNRQSKLHTEVTLGFLSRRFREQKALQKQHRRV